MRKRIHREVNARADWCQFVLYDPDRNVIVVDDYPLPAGWNHETTTIVIELPDEYPRRVPDVYVPDDLRFKGAKPHTRMSSAPVGWYRFDLRPLSNHWIPERDTVVTVLQQFYGSLDDPTSVP